MIFRTEPKKVVVTGDSFIFAEAYIQDDNSYNEDMYFIAETVNLMKTFNKIMLFCEADGGSTWERVKKFFADILDRISNFFSGFFGKGKNTQMLPAVIGAEIVRDNK